MKIDLTELLKHRVIDEETAQRLQDYYRNKSVDSRASRFLLILSLIGVVLVGLGSILIIAYNWDIFPKWAKLLVAFIPLLFSQLAGMYVLKNKTGEPVWTESVSLAIFFSLGLAISLLSQIYHIEADISGFIKWWIILAAALPVVFHSRSVSLALWIAVGCYLTNIPWLKNQEYDFFPLLIITGLSVWYYVRWKKELNNNLLIIHHWTIPIILTIFLFFNVNQMVCERFVVAGCLILFLVFGAMAFGPFSGQKFLSNGYRVAQFLGIWVVGIIMTFDFFWSDFSTGELLGCVTNNFMVPGILLLIGGFVGWLYLKKRIILEPDNMVWLGVLLIPVLFIGDFHSPTGQFLSNLIVLAAAAKLIYEGVTGENLIVVNLGLLALTVWVLAWFFGHDFSYIWKGLLFIALGLLCFGINVMIIKKQKR